jgi:hypothetical protein
LKHNGENAKLAARKHEKPEITPQLGSITPDFLTSVNEHICAILITAAFWRLEMEQKMAET